MAQRNIKLNALQLSTAAMGGLTFDNLVDNDLNILNAL